MTVERTRNRLLYKAAGFRCASQVIAGAAGVVDHAGQAVQHLGNALYGIRSALFFLEADAARQYEDLTGIDLGGMLGNPEIYTDRPREQLEQ